MKTRIITLIAVVMLAGTLMMNVSSPPVNAASQTSINTAIAKGLTYLNSTQQSDGSWGPSLMPIASTAMAILAFENQGHYGWNTTDHYHNTVRKGLNWLFSQGANITITNQTAGNPDTNGNHIGVCWAGEGYPIYESPMALMAIVASNAPTNVTTSGPLGVRTYRSIVQDIVDFLAWAQADPGSSYRGGWTYTAENNASYTADNSNTAWPVLALMTAELWNINAPAFVRSELNYWVATCQDLTGNPTSNSQYGSFGYYEHVPYGGVVDTASGVLQLTYLGATSTNASTIAAEGYMNRMWSVDDGSWNVNIGNLYCMYGVMKAMREAKPTPIRYIANYTGTPGVEWYNGTGEYADALINNQDTNGSWINWKSWEEIDAYSVDLSTALGILILESVPVRVTYSLTVTVEDATNNNPITGATVKAVGPLNYSGTTGSNGQINFNSVQAGNYQVNASASGYYPSGAKVSLTSTTAITIKLTPTAPPPAPTKPIGGEIEPINVPMVLLAGIEGMLSTYWVAVLAIAVIAACIIFRRRHK